MAGTRWGVLNWRQEFTDKPLEIEYTKSSVVDSLKYTKPVTLSMGILYFLFIIPDYLLISKPETFLLILLNRTLVCLSVFALYVFISRSKQYNLFYRLYSFYEIAVTLDFFLIFYLYENANFLINTLGLCIFIISIFMLPNRWLGRSITAAIIGIGFFLFANVAFQGTKPSDYWAGVVYVSLVIVLRAVGSYNNEYHRRMLFLKSKELERLSKTDPMTGIYNRATFNQQLDACIIACHEQSIPFSLVIFDIDNFKGVNDKFGHLTGDRVLIDIVCAVKEQIAESDMLFRWGGEEFVMLLQGKSPGQTASMVEGIRKMIEEFVFEEAARITCSFGIATYEDGDDLFSLLSRADKYLYTAKSNGKNRIESGPIKAAFFMN